MSTTLGAVIAGGASTRFGSPKALAEVAGERVVDRVIATLLTVVPDVVAIANDASLARAIGLPFRGDVFAGAGALGGIHASLLWASERGEHGVLAVACDMPFLPAVLLGAVLGRANDAIDVVVPESTGRRGVEPLAAYYSVTCIPAMEAALERGDHRMIAFHEDVRVARLPLDVVRGFGDPAVLFMNLNTPGDRALAQRIAGPGS